MSKNEIKINNKVSDEISNLNLEIKELNVENFIERVLEGSFLQSEVAILDKSNDTKKNLVKSGVVEFNGKRNGKDLQDLINKNINKGIAELNYYTAPGVYREIVECRQNKDMERHLPKLKISANLFKDDIINGSYFGDESELPSKFQFFKNGVEITDQNIKDKFTEYLNPSKSHELTSTLRSFNEVNAENIYNGRRDKSSLVRVIKNRDIAADLYIKFVLKEAKVKNSKKIKPPKTTVSNESVLPLVNKAFTDLGLPTVSTESDLSHIPQNVLNILPEGSIKYTKSESTEDIPTLERKEYLTKENFVEFCERMLFTDTHLSTNIVKVENKGVSYFDKLEYTKSLNKNKSQKVSMESAAEIATEDAVKEVDLSYSFYLNTTPITDECGYSLIKEIKEAFLATEDNKYSYLLSNESSEIISTDFIGTLNDTLATVLDKMSFKDIYGSNINTMLQRAKNGCKSTEHFGNESSVNWNSDNIDITNKSLTETLFMKALNYVNKEDTFKGITISNEANNSEPIRMFDYFGVNNDPKDEEINTGRVERMFRMIKGDTTITLDNERTIKLIVGNDLIGCLHIDYTHEEVQHFVNMRTLMSSPSSFASSVDIFSSLQHEANETLGKQTFVNCVKPILEEQMGSKFLRDNSDILNVLNTLLIETELGNSLTRDAMSSASQYNLSRVSFIPASELIMYRNGMSGRGESTFQQAFVPANLVMLANDAYVHWYCVEGKGYSIIQIPQGLSDINGEYGTDNFTEEIQNTIMTRSSVRQAYNYDMPLGRNIFTMTVPEGSSLGNYDIKNIDLPDFSIDPEWVKNKEQEATFLTGYSSASFSSTDGTVELARKLFEIQGTKMLEVITAQEIFKRPASTLATKMLHARCGEEAEGVIVKWNPPSPNRSNKNLKSEMMDERVKLFNSYLEVIEHYIPESEENRDELVASVKRILSEQVYKDMSIVSDLKSLCNKGRIDVNLRLSDVTKDVEKDEGEDEDE